MKRFLNNYFSLSSGVFRGGVLICWFASLGACSSNVSNTPVNDAVPSGTLIYQGTFSGLNGKTCSGTCKIYQSTDNLGTFYIRLESMTIESDGSDLDVYSTINATNTNIADLKSLTGSRNYTYSPGVGAYTFTATKVQKQSDATVFCEALLTAVP